jgi:hypothetical protein
VAAGEQVTSSPGLSPDISGILYDMFARLEAERNHGRTLVSHALGYLAASRHGLTETEVLDVLSADKEVMADFRKRSPKSPTSERLPVVVWARLCADIEPYMTQRLADGTTVLTFYHRQVGEAVTTRYSPEQEKCGFHDALATYFHRLAAPIGAERRPLGEMAYQMAKAQLWRVLEETFIEFAFQGVRHSGIHATAERFSVCHDCFADRKPVMLDVILNGLHLAGRECCLQLLANMAIYTWLRFEATAPSDTSRISRELLTT